MLFLENLLTETPTTLISRALTHTHLSRLNATHSCTLCSNAQGTPGAGVWHMSQAHMLSKVLRQASPAGINLG